MIYKKTWLSCLLWAVYTCLTGVMLANYAILFWQKKINAAMNCGTVLFVAAVFAAGAGLYFLIRKLTKLVKEKYTVSGRTIYLWEVFAVLSIFFIGLLYRIFLYLQNMDDLTVTQYYQMAAVKEENVVEPMIHGASYFYTMCLSFVLSFLGNKVIAAVWLQILVQMLTVLFAFFTVRSLAGRLPACIVMFMLAVSSVYAGQALTMTPESLLFLLYLAGMFVVGGYVRNDCRYCFKTGQAFLGAALAGLTIGFLTYLDAVCLTLVILLFGLFTGVRGGEMSSEQDSGEKSGRSMGSSVLLFLTALLSGGLIFWGLLALNAYSYYMETEELLREWLMLYQNSLPIDYVFYRTEISLIECMVLVLAACFLIAAFWNRKRVQNASFWMCLLFLLAPTPLSAVGVLSYQVFSIFLWSVLAGIGLQQSFVTENVEAFSQQMTVELSDDGEPEERSVAEKPRFLENPLPLPKKHEKRTMDYQYEIAQEQMVFDLEPDENDDFDIL